jgi:hypothetical protein
VPVFFGRLPIARLEACGMRFERKGRLRNLLPDDMYDKGNAAFEPGEARVEDQIYEPGERRTEHAALVSVHALLPGGQRRILIHRERRVRAAVLFPVAVVGVVVIVVLRPNVLRHAGRHAENKPEDAIEPVRAEQTAVPTFVHQCKDAQRKKADQQNDRDDEPAVSTDAQCRRPPKQCERPEGRQDLYQSLEVTGPSILTDDDPLLLSNAADRCQHWSPPASTRYLS